MNQSSFGNQLDNINTGPKCGPSVLFHLGLSFIIRELCAFIQLEVNGLYLMSQSKIIANSTICMFSADFLRQFYLNLDGFDHLSQGTCRISVGWFILLVLHCSEQSVKRLNENLNSRMLWHSVFQNCDELDISK